MNGFLCPWKDNPCIGLADFKRGLRNWQNDRGNNTTGRAILRQTGCRFVICTCRESGRANVRDRPVRQGIEGKIRLACVALRKLRDQMRKTHQNKCQRAKRADDIASQRVFERVRHNTLISKV